MWIDDVFEVHDESARNATSHFGLDLQRSWTNKISLGLPGQHTRDVQRRYCRAGRCAPVRQYVRVYSACIQD